MSKKKFNAYKYATEFEQLSLEIIKIIYFSDRNNEITEKKTTHKTRDQGVDGYIKFKINGADYTYTVEAKLRTSNSLGLKDFASSILYSLINLSTRHFVVTNILYSEEAIKTINSLNTQRKGNIDLIDGRKLQSIINSQLALSSSFPKPLIKHICERKFKISSNQNIDYVREEISSVPYYVSSDIEKTKEKFFSDYKANIRLYMVQGEKGTGKTSLIKHIIESVNKMDKRNLSNSLTYYEINMKSIGTPYLFCMEIIQIFTGINLLDLLSFLSDTDKNSLLSDSIFADFDDEIVSIIKFLLDEKETNYINHKYYIRKFLPKIINCRKGINSVALHFSGIDKVCKDQLEFLYEMLNCFTQNNILVFVEFLIPIHQKQIPLIKLEDWYDIKEVFCSYKDQSAISSVITVSEYSTENKTELLQAILPHNCTHEYYQRVSNVLGHNPEMFHIGLDYITREKLYTIPLIEANREHLTNVKEFYSKIYSIHSENKVNISLIDYAIYTAGVLEGYVPKAILNILASNFHNAETTLLNTMLFTKEHFDIKIASDHIFDIPSIENNVVGEKVLCDILSNIENIFNQEHDRQYYTCYIHILQGNVDKAELENVLNELKRKRNARRIEKLLYSLYKVMLISKRKEIHILNVITEYLNYISNQYLYYTTKSKNLFKVAEQLCESIVFSEDYNKKDIEVLLKYYVLMYNKNKMCYNNEETEKYINKILYYENTLPQYSSYYINAHKYKALAYKERGEYKMEFKEYIAAIRKYPQSRELKISFGMNASAHYYYKNFPKAMRIMNELINCVNVGNGSYKKHLWLYHDFEMLKIRNGKSDLTDLLNMRKYAEIISASNILARNYNIEGYHCFRQNNYVKAFKCFELAVTICKMSGRNKPYFLFLSNLITTGIILGKDMKDNFEDGLSWLQRHADDIGHRLKKSNKVMTEHLFATLVSYLISGLTLYGINNEMQVLVNNKCYDIPYTQKKQLLEQVHEAYHLNNNLIILF